MLKNLSQNLFYMTLVVGTMISITTPSWMIMWIGLEMNMLSFIPLMSKNKTPYETECSMKYFLVQAMASMMFLMSILTFSFMEMNNTMMLILNMSLLIKMGSVPFHLWFPSVMQGISWMNCAILMTWQKIAPMLLLSYKLSNSNFLYTMVLMSTIVGSVSGWNQTSTRKMMAYSSISHVGWMIAAMLISTKYWSMYFMFYTITSFVVIFIMNKFKIMHLNQILMMKKNELVKLTLFISLLSLGGLPPFTGFIPKWIIIQTMVSNQMLMLTLVMVMTSLITLFFYLRMTYSAFTFKSSKMNWYSENNEKMKIMTIMLIISTIGIPFISITPLM